MKKLLLPLIFLTSCASSKKVEPSEPLETVYLFGAGDMLGYITYLELRLQEYERRNPRQRRNPEAAERMPESEGKRQRRKSRRSERRARKMRAETGATSGQD